MAHDSVLDALSHFLHPRSSRPPISEADQQFLIRFREMVEQHLGEPEFTTASAAALIGMSRMHLNRKLRALTRQSTHEYIRRVRLEGARALLSQPLPVAFIAHCFGFKSMSNFAKAFRHEFGTSPSIFRAKQNLAREPKIQKPGEE